jgi:hypothetical protein
MLCDWTRLTRSGRCSANQRKKLPTLRSCLSKEDSRNDEESPKPEERTEAFTEQATTTEGHEQVGTCCERYDFGQVQGFQSKYRQTDRKQLQATSYAKAEQPLHGAQEMAAPFMKSWETLLQVRADTQRAEFGGAHREITPRVVSSTPARTSVSPNR